MVKIVKHYYSPTEFKYRIRRFHWLLGYQYLNNKNDNNHWWTIDFSSSVDFNTQSEAYWRLIEYKYGGKPKKFEEYEEVII